MMTLRQEVERDLGIAGIELPITSSVPRAWRKTIKYWFALAVGFVSGAVTAGVVAVFVNWIA